MASATNWYIWQTRNYWYYYPIHRVPAKSKKIDILVDLAGFRMGKYTMSGWHFEILKIGQESSHASPYSWIPRGFGFAKKAKYKACPYLRKSQCDEKNRISSKQRKGKATRHWISEWKKDLKYQRNLVTRKTIRDLVSIITLLLQMETCLQLSSFSWSLF